jgi:hypothetical protein
MRDLLVSSHDALLSEDDAERSFWDSDDEDTIIFSNETRRSL